MFSMLPLIDSGFGQDVYEQSQSSHSHIVKILVIADKKHTFMIKPCSIILSNPKIRFLVPATIKIFLLTFPAAVVINV